MRIYNSHEFIILWPSLFDQPMASPASRTSHSMFQIGTSLLGLAPAQTYWLIRFAILEPLFTCSNMSVISVISIVDILIQETHQSTSHFGLHPRLPGFDLYRTPPYQEPGTCGDPIRRVSLFPFPLPQMALQQKGNLQKKLPIFVTISHIFPTYFPFCCGSIPPIGRSKWFLPSNFPAFWSHPLARQSLVPPGLAGTAKSGSENPFCSNFCGSILEYDDKPENLGCIILFGTPIWSSQIPNQSTSIWDPKMKKCTL